jgi:transposase
MHARPVVCTICLHENHCSPAVLEYRRRLAIERVNDGYTTQEVADFLGVDPSSVRRWIASFRRHGGDALAVRPVPGRPPKLTYTQEKIVRRWLADHPTEHGFATELWTAPRRAQLIEQEWGIHFHPDYLGTWLRQRGYTPHTESSNFVRSSFAVPIGRAR